MVTCRSGSGCHTLEPFEETKDGTELNQRDQSVMKEQPEFAAELEFVKELAREAAAVAISRAKRVTPVEKANLSFVTDLDQDLEQLIRRRLGERYPDDRLTGEEYAAEGGGGGSTVRDPD